MTMREKKQRRDRARRFTADGLPRDGREWSVEDWRDLWHGMEEVKRKIAARHREGGRHDNGAD